MKEKIKKERSTLHNKAINENWHRCFINRETRNQSKIKEASRYEGKAKIKNEEEKTAEKISIDDEPLRKNEALRNIRSLK